MSGPRAGLRERLQQMDCSRCRRRNELALSTHTRRMRFSGPLTGVLCKRPFPEFVAKIRIQRQRSSADIYRSCEQNCNRPAAFKNATVPERRGAAMRPGRKQPFGSPQSGAAKFICPVRTTRRSNAPRPRCVPRRPPVIRRRVPKLASLARNRPRGPAMVARSSVPPDRRPGSARTGPGNERSSGNPESRVQRPYC